MVLVYVRDMPSEEYFECPHCNQRVDFRFFEEAYPVKLICCHCYRPLIRRSKNGPITIRRERIKETGFLIHSSKVEDRNILSWLREILRLYGVKTYIIEEDARAIDWLHKSREGIDQHQLIVVLLSKRYQYLDDSNELKWKGPDKCYDEIAMAFQRYRQIIALVEKDVDPGRVLERVAWCYFFERDENGDGISIKDGIQLFIRLDQFLDNVVTDDVTYITRKN